jgi:hypothetical protein
VLRLGIRNGQPELDPHQVEKPDPDSNQVKSRIRILIKWKHEAVEAHSGAMEAHSGTVEVINRALDFCSGALEGLL